MNRRSGWGLAAVAVCAAWWVGAAAARLSARQSDSRAPGIDVSVVDADGRPVADLLAAQFTVTVDGTPRAVRSARFVFRGPGAESAARGAALARDSAAAPLFEPRRTILVVVDETSFPPGTEKSVVSATDRLLDRFGPGDHVALVTIPIPADSLAIGFTGDRSSIRDTLARIVGRGAQADLLAEMNAARLDVPGVDSSSSAAAASSGAEGGASGRPVEEPRQEAAFAKGQDAGPRAQRQRPLDVAARLLAGLAVAPGPKTLVLVTAGLADADGQNAAALRSEMQAVETAAATSRSAFYVLGLPSPGRPEGWSDLERLSVATGGALVRAGRSADAALDRIGLALSGFYHLELEPAAADDDGKPHTFMVSVARPSVTVRAPRRVARRDDPPFFAVPPQPDGPAGAPGEPATAPTREPAAARRDDGGPDREVETVVARAAEYVSGYFREFRDVVAEEDYLQTIPAQRPAETRRMKSDFLLVTTADGNTWVPFRDVFEVDGRAVRDRDDRLRKLFLESPPGTAYQAMARVQDEGARYNLVALGKTDINVPTFALTILLDRNIHAFAFKRGREETVEGARLLRVDFRETATPTLVRGADGGDVPASGSLWIDPLTGRVVKTFLRAARGSGPAALAGLTLESTVVFRRSDSLGLWVPAEMREAYRLRGNSVEGHASYSNFRSFQVRTDVK
jgi:VWFA-related protein